MFAVFPGLVPRAEPKPQPSSSPATKPGSRWSGARRPAIPWRSTVRGQDVFGLTVKTQFNRASDWRIAGYTGRMRCGVTGGITGRGADLLIIDGPIKDALEASSETYRDRAWNWYTSTARTREPKRRDHRDSARRQRLGGDVIGRAHVLVTHAQIGLAKVRERMPKAPGTRGQLRGATPGPMPGGARVTRPGVSTVPTLAELGVTRTEMKRGQALLRLPVKLQEAVAQRETTLSKVLHQVKRVIRRQKVEAQSRVAALDAVIVQSDWRSWLEAQDLCDLLLTDPPYSTDVADICTFAHDWLPAALAKVKPTGRAYVCVGAYPDELAAYLSAPRASLILAQVLVSLDLSEHDGSDADAGLQTELASHSVSAWSEGSGANKNSAASSGIP